MYIHKYILYKHYLVVPIIQKWKYGEERCLYPKYWDSFSYMYIKTYRIIILDLLALFKNLLQKDSLFENCYSDNYATPRTK